MRGASAPRESDEMQTQNPFLDEMAKLTTAAMGMAQAAGEEAKAAFRSQADRMVAELDLVRRARRGDAEAFRTTYGGTPLDDDTLAFVVAPERCVVDTTNHYFQPVHWSAAGGVPVTYVVNTLDRPVPPALQHVMLGRLPGSPHVVELDSGHVPAITAPAALAAILAPAPGR